MTAIDEPNRGRLARRRGHFQGFPSAFMTRSAPGAGAKRGGPPASKQTRAANLVPGTYDAASRTVSVVLSTFAPAKRYGFVETVSADPADWDVSRVDLGQCKLLDSHRTSGVDAVLGTLTEAKFENGQLVGRVALAESEAARAAEVDIASGHLRGISIGYNVGAWTLIESGDVETWRASQITLMEASLVAVPIDPGAMVRGADEGDAGVTAPGAEGRRVYTFEEGERLIDRARFFSSADGERLARDMIARGADETTIIRAVREVSARTPDPTATIGGPRGNLARQHAYGAREMSLANRHNDESADNPDAVRQALENAIYARIMGATPEGLARQFMAAPLVEYPNIIAEAHGERRSWLDRTAGRLFGGDMTRAHSLSDFTNLLMGAGNRVLQAAYESAASPLALLSRERSSSDFRAITTLRVSEAPQLRKVLENGEVTYGSRGEESVAFKLETFARIFSMTREAVINDDLNAFGDFSRAFARAAAETVANQLVALFTANSGAGVNLPDGNPVFTPARGNRASSGSAISVATLAAARQALRETKGIDGVTPIGLTPRYLLVGPAQETAAEQAISAILANQTSNVNPFAGKLEVLVEPRFTGNAWRLFADPAQQAIISHAYLAGRRGPMLETREGWSTLGAEFRAVLDFGCGATDWRGAYLNPGA